MALELNQEIITTEPVAAATVIVLREAPVGFEVLLLRRHAASGVLGGAYVFPGGKIDSALDQVRPDQIHPDLRELRLRLDEAHLTHDVVGCLYAAAVRETFEESGLLLGWNSATPQQLNEAASGLRKGRPMSEVLENTRWQLDAQTLLPWSRWITPRQPSVTKRRFDTRFFISTLPTGQTVTHDGHEATESVWITPASALRKFWTGLIDLAAPQIITLQHLARFATIDRVFEHAKTTKPRTIEPAPFDLAGFRVTCYPGDPQHSDPNPAWPGPSRLTFRNGRFEPDGGLKALLDLA